MNDTISNIQTSYHIKHIDLSHNEFSEAAGQVLGPAIGNNVPKPLSYDPIMMLLVI